MYGLHRIIQIDGFVKGKRTVINVDKHAMLNGTNGAGKTATLKLLSFFYGGNPSQLELHSRGRDTFVDWYLPRPSSLLIFEYSRESGLCCVVAYRHKSNIKHAYRFLEGGFSEDRFSEKDTEGVSRYLNGTDLKSHWRNMGLTCSEQIEEVIKYKAIIQNDIQHLPNRVDVKQVRRLAASYNLGDRKTHMRFIERICASISSRHGNMERIKDMLADIMSEDGVIFPVAHTHKENASLINEVAALRRFEQDIPKLYAVLKQHRERLELETGLIKHAGHLLYSKEIIEKEVAYREIELQGFIDSLRDLVAVWEVDHFKLVDTCSKTLSNYEQSKHVVESLKDQYAQYKESDMEQKATDFDNLPSFAERHEGAEKRLHKLSAEVVAEEVAMLREMANENSRHEKKGGDLETKIASEKEHRSICEREHDAAVSSLQTREQVAINEARDVATPKEKELYLAMGKAMSDVEKGSYTNEEGLQLAILKEHIRTLSRSLSKFKGEVSDKRNEYLSAKEEFSDKEKDLKQAKKRLTTASDECDALHQLAFAQDGTWLKKLREHDTGWAMRLGKVVNPELLQRRDIKPEFITSDSAEIFGWSIKLDAIEAPPHALAEDEIRARHQAKEEEVAKRREEVVACEKELEKASKVRATAKAKLEESERAAFKAESDKEMAENNLHDEESLINEAVGERRRAAKKEAERLETAISQLKADLEAKIIVIKATFFEELSELKSLWDSKRIRFDEAIAKINSQMSDEARYHKSRVSEINSDYDKLCSEKGIDEQTLKEARQKVSETKKRLEEIQALSSDVSAYREWISVHWKTLDKHVDEMNHHREANRKADESMEDRKRLYESEKDEINKEKLLTGRSLLTAKERLTSIEECKSRIESFSNLSEKMSHELPLSLLLQTISSDLNSNDELSQKIIKSIHEINNRIERLGESKIATAWYNSKEELRKRLGMETTTKDRFLLNLPEQFEGFINDEIKSARRTQLLTLRAVGKGLIDYFEDLKNIDNAISHQSTKISKVIQNNLSIDALSAIELNMASRVKTFDYWNQLHDFSRQWCDWRESESDDLPDDELLTSLSCLIESLQGLKSGVNIRDYFDFSIMMIENGQKKIIRNDNELEASTSEGLKYLALCVMFIGISRLLCPDRNVNLHWPIDELGILHRDNTARLFKMLDDNGIVMVGGFPSEDPDLLRLFTHRHVIDRVKGVRMIELPRSTLSDKILDLKRSEAVNDRAS